MGKQLFCSPSLFLGDWEYRACSGPRNALPRGSGLCLMTLLLGPRRVVFGLGYIGGCGCCPAGGQQSHLEGDGHTAVSSHTWGPQNTDTLSA